MKPKLLIRIAAGFVLFFAVGHSMGHATRRDATDEKSREVLKILSEHKFDLFGEMRSWDENYTGMSLNFIFTLLAFTVNLWVASNRAINDPKGTKWIILPIMLALFGYAATSYLYFFNIPAITSLVAGVLLAIAAIRLNRASL